MTNPPSSWIQELIGRYKRQNEDTTYRSPTPLGFDFERPAFDPSTYYRQYGTLRDISRAGTRVEEQIQANRRRAELEAAQRAAMQAGQQTQHPAIDLRQQSGTATGVGQGLINPLGNLHVTSEYGWRNHPVRGGQSFHSGIDFSAPTGTPIYATHSGYISMAGWNGGYGNTVIIDGANGLQTLYAHQSRVGVKNGQFVRQGQLIGYVGSTGVSTGPHLHYEVIINGQKVNPRQHLRW